jgi:hypothetical protein
MRNAIPKKGSELQAVIREIDDIGHELNLEARIGKLAKCCNTIIGEFEKISRDERLGITRGHFQDALTRVRDEIVRVAGQNGL